jgi:hypothetical protein
VKFIRLKNLSLLILIFGIFICLIGSINTAQPIHLTSNNRVVSDHICETMKYVTCTTDYDLELFEIYGPQCLGKKIPMKIKQSDSKASQKNNLTNIHIKSFKMYYDGTNPLISQLNINNNTKLSKRRYKIKNLDHHDSAAYSFDKDYEENDPYIIEIAMNITKDLDEPTRAEITSAVYEWVDEHVEYEKPTYYESKHYAAETAKLGKGNCCDQARLVIALLRACGIPRNATQFYHSNSVKMLGGRVVGHVWPVVILENNEVLICDTSSYSSSLGSPGWENIGYTDQHINLEY